MSRQISLEDIFLLYKDRIAVVDADCAMSYGELDELSAALAETLLPYRHSGNKVILVLDRSIEALVAISAAIRAGICYVPLEWDGHDTHAFERLQGCGDIPAVAVSRHAQALSDLGIAHIAMDNLSRDRGRNVSRDSFPDIDANHLIYTIYTSGSTGISKGVDITRASIWHYTTSLISLLSINESLSYAYMSSLSADLGNTSLFLSLLTGGTLHFISDTLRRDACEFQRYMREQRIDVVKITPSHFTSLTMHHYTDFTLKWLIFGGESLQSERVRTVFQKGWARAVANHYGPTETTVGVALFPMRNLNDVPDDLVVPVGFPIGQSRFELVDEEGQRLAGEAVGELMIGGPGVATGYTNDPQLTTTKFYRLPHRMADGPFYASGDLFRRSKTGAYIFIGRKDRQVKIRGYRVDPDAIEALIAYEDDVESAAIFACDSDRPGHSQLVACIVPKQPAEDSVLSMQSLLSRILPAHMMPGRIVLLSTMPVTDNGKVDYKALKAQLSVPARHVENTLHVAGLEGNERVAASAWRQCLGSHPHRYDENFYDAGGDSILAIQLLSLLQNENYPVRASHFYQDPTFTRLIQAMDTELQPAVSPQQGISERYLAPVQHWFFEQFPQGVDRWSQAMVIDAAQKINVAAFRKALDGLLKAHPILGTCFIQRTGGWSVEDNVCEVADIFRCLELQGSAEELENMIERAHQEIAIRTGQLLRIWLLKGLDGHDRLLMVCHHLVIDGVSWRILIDDLARLYESARDNIQRSVAIEPRLYWSWSRQLKTLAATLPAEEVYPEAAANLAKLRNDFRLGPNSEGSANTLWIGFDERQSHALLRDIPRQHCVAIQHLLLAAYVRSVADVLASGGTHLSVDIESHGRQLFEDELEMNRAMGWFTAVYPLIAEVVDGEPVLLTARRLANLAEKQADAGALYGIRRYLSDAPRKSVKGSELCFNFLGHFGLDSDASLGWSWSNLYPGAARHPDVSRVHLLKLTGRVVANRLTLDLSYSSNVHSRQTITRIGERFIGLLNDALQKAGVNAAAEQTSTLFSEHNSTGLLTYIPSALSGLRETRPSGAFRAVLLTGATGFIGIYLLKMLLATPGCVVHCLVRGDDQRSAQERLWERFCWYFPHANRDALSARVVVHEGSLNSVDFGLAPAAFTRLAREIDTVVHAAADVRLMAPLDELRQTNVEGTCAIVEFCHMERAKRLHFVSTLSVAGIVTDKQSFSEDHLHIGQSFMTPYEQSKYEAELVVRAFIREGGSACIYRTGSVSADSTGTFQINIESNRLMQSLNTYVLSGLIPDREEDLLLCRVDDLAHAIVRIVMNTRISGRTFHMTPDAEFMHNDLVEVLQASGFSVQLASTEKYLSALRKMDADFPREAALGQMWSTRPSRKVRIDAAVTHTLLKRLDAEIPPVDRAWFTRFLACCVERGFLPGSTKV
ncbi:non-ribosomal peptide synthetase [Salmonella enterica]|nr:non-ribosomal peptide synthetase [Salmonella enterica]MDJ7089698.1 non-ribosomal peptide synthetase [Salmonella enterica]